MTWTRDDAGVWTKTESDREAVIAEEKFPQGSAYRIKLAEVGHAVLALILASGDGRNGFEVGIGDFGFGTEAVIRTVTWSVPAASHDPANGHVLQKSAVTLPSGEPYVIEIRTLDDTIELFLNDADTPNVSWNNAQDAIYTKQNRYGFVSSTPGATVLSAELCDLVANVKERQDVLIAVAGGDVYASVDDESLALIASGIFSESGSVDLAEMNGRMYGVDGSRAVAIDPVELTAEKLIPTVGTLPGAIEDPPGTPVPGATRCTIISTFGSRLVWGGDPQDPQNLNFSAVGDPLDYDYGDPEPGRAFALGAQNRPKIGQPVTAVLQIDRQTLVIGCTNSIWRMQGDPALGIPVLDPPLRSSGVSGPEAIILAEEGFVLAHSPDGLLAVGDRPVNVSRHVLTEGIQIPRNRIEDYVVSVARDTRRHYAHVFLTPADPEKQGLHFAYDERVGGYTPGRGGFFPETFPPGLDPTAAVTWQGRVILGTRSGLLVEYDPEQHTDDGSAIDCRFPVQLLDAPGVENDAVLDEVTVRTDLDSDPVTCSLYGGMTAEGAYDDARRWPLFSVTLQPPGDVIRRNGRAPALVLDITNEVSQGAVTIEAIEARLSVGQLTHRPRAAAAAAPAVCTPPGGTIEDPDTPPDDPLDDGPGSGDDDDIFGDPDDDGDPGGDDEWFPTWTESEDSRPSGKQQAET